MNLIARLFILTSLLIYNVISCKLYNDIEDNAEQIKDMLDDNRQSFNALESSSKNNSKSRRPRSADTSYLDQVTNQEPLVGDVADMQPDTNSLSQQFNIQTNEAKNIMSNVSSSKSDYNKVEEELEKVKHTLDEMKRLTDEAASYLEQARKASGYRQANQTLLPILHEAIGKVKSRHATLNVCYTDATASLDIADTAFGNAHSWAEKALEEASKKYNIYGI
ncbi:immunogenic protein P37 [Borrelia sp. A-FGy1]|uniref:immunogenic protein P37 n=1 Tax=Borrelia sp. A-FGy1 TaxID=2608247 RepID=UPI001E5A3722|nr:immunogenic protein P37 [Borrelia sp. A-FGy1]